MFKLIEALKSFPDMIADKVIDEICDYGKNTIERKKLKDVIEKYFTTKQWRDIRENQLFYSGVDFYAFILYCEDEFWNEYKKYNRQEIYNKVFTISHAITPYEQNCIMTVLDNIYGIVEYSISFSDADVFFRDDIARLEHKIDSFKDDIIDEFENALKRNIATLKSKENKSAKLFQNKFYHHLYFDKDICVADIYITPEKILKNLLTFLMSNIDYILLIEGVAGSGKTTLISKISTMYYFDDFYYISLKELIHEIKAGNGFLNCISHKYNIDPYKENLVFLFDGFDEIANIIDRDNFLDDLQSLVERKSKIVMTSRPGNFNYINLTYMKLTLYPFDNLQIKQWIQLYSNKKNLSIDKYTIIRSVGLENKMNDLLRIPIILYFVISLELDITQIKNKGNLFDEVFDKLKNDKSERTKHLIDKHYEIASMVSINMELNNTTTMLVGDIDKLFSNINEPNYHNFYSSVLAEFIEGTYEICFIHKSIQDYFASKYLYNIILLENKEKLTELLTTHKFLYDVFEYISYFFNETKIKTLFLKEYIKYNKIYSTETGVKLTNYVDNVLVICDIILHDKLNNLLAEEEFSLLVNNYLNSCRGVITTPAFLSKIKCNCVEISSNKIVGASIFGSDFNNVQFDNVLFFDSNIYDNTSFNHCEFKHSIFDNCYLENIIFRTCDLSTSIIEANLTGVQFLETTLPEFIKFKYVETSSFAGMEFKGLYVSNCSFRKSTFTKTDIRRSTFYECSFTECDFNKVMFENCVFINCRFQSNKLVRCVDDDNRFLSCSPHSLFSTKQ